LITATKICYDRYLKSLDNRKKTWEIVSDGFAARTKRPFVL
jgi:hypothetical protein